MSRLLHTARLLNGTLTAHRQARESSTAWTDNDIGLYVPFFNTNLDDLPPDSSTTYVCTSLRELELSSRHIQHTDNLDFRLL